MRGMPKDGGLYMPSKIMPLPKDFIERFRGQSFTSVAHAVAKHLFADQLPASILREAIKTYGHFDDPPVPIKQLANNIYVLELFQGPTMAFKDFAAQFMGPVFKYLAQKEGKKMTMLVATSGDTGSAVAKGFYQMDGIRVVILYPRGRVSHLQEQQLTSLGGNITALEVAGTFDNCQQLAKKALRNKDLKKYVNLTSANSINILRLLPQTFYYIYACTQLVSDLPLVFSVPSGNFGNLTAGLIAKKMNAPIQQFVVAMNVNSVGLEFLRHGSFTQRDVIPTVSNAMDVGNPSNLCRIADLYNYDVERMNQDMHGVSFNDNETKSAIREVFESYGYILDPHGAVAYLGIRAHATEFGYAARRVFLETAHPAKFDEVVGEVIGKKTPLPARLQEYLQRPKQAIQIANKFTALKEHLLDL